MNAQKLANNDFKYKNNVVSSVFPVYFTCVDKHINLLINSVTILVFLPKSIFLQYFDQYFVSNKSLRPPHSSVNCSVTVILHSSWRSSRRYFLSCYFSWIIYFTHMLPEKYFYPYFHPLSSERLTAFSTKA